MGMGDEWSASHLYQVHDGFTQLMSSSSEMLKVRINNPYLLLLIISGLDTLLVKARTQRWPFVFEVERAQMGWPGITTMVEPFIRDKAESDNKVIEEKRAIHNQHAKQLFGLLWQTHLGADLSKMKGTDPWANG